MSDSAPLPPSGQQIELRAGAARAIVVTVGGGVRSLRLAGREVIDGNNENEDVQAFKGHHLLPWPNRVKDGRWRWRGVEQQLALNEPELNNALHGLVCWTSWSVVEVADSEALLRTAVPPQPGWPGWLTATCRWRLEPDGLSAEIQVRNDSPASLPFGYGAHPYIRAVSGSVDGELLQVPARIRLLTDERLVPLGEETVSGTAYDFSSSTPVGQTVLDTCFGDLTRRPDGTVAAHLGDVEVWGDASFRWFQVYSGDRLPGAQRRRSIAIEPMTCPPDALRTGTDLIVLEPGATWSGTWGIRVGPRLRGTRHVRLAAAGAATRHGRDR